MATQTQVAAQAPSAETPTQWLRESKAGAIPNHPIGCCVWGARPRWLGCVHPPAVLRTFLRRTLYFLLGLLGLVILLVGGAWIALQFDSTQDFVARKAETYLRAKLGTTVKIGRFRTDFRHAINLDGVYLADQRNDTLLSVGHLGVSLNFWALTKKQVSISAIELNDGRVRLTRTEPDSVTNYDFLLAAFTDPTAPADTAASGITVEIDRVRLTNIHFTQDDQVAGANIRAHLGEVDVTMDEVDFDHEIYRVDEAILRRVGVSIVQSKTAPEVESPAPTQPLTLQVGLNRLALDSVAFSYRNGPAAQYISTHIGEAELTARAIDLQHERIDLKKLTLKNARLAYAQNEAVPVKQRVVNPAEAVRTLNEAAQKAKPTQPLNWRVTLDESAISGVEVAFDNFNQPRQKTKLAALDYNHLHFTDLTLNTEGFFFSENRTTATVTQLAGVEQSGFRVDSWRARVVYDSVQIRLDSLDLVTPHTHLARTLAIGYESLDALTDTRRLADLKIEGDFRNVRIGFRDILYLAPDLINTPPFSVNPAFGVRLNGLVAGRVGDFTVENLAVSGLRGTDLKIRRGRIRGLPNVDGRLYTDLDIAHFRTTRGDIESVVPRGTIPATISLPPSIALSGRFRGNPTTLQFNTALTVSTTYGSVAFSGDLGAAQANGRQPLVGTFAVKGFDVGRLLKNPQVGRITATGRLNASGNLQDLATLVGRVQAKVQRAEYGGYAYRGIDATVDLDRNRYAISATSKQDPNLNLDLRAIVDLRDPKNPSYEVTSLNLRGANLTALGFYTGGDLRVQGNLTAKLRGADANSLNGTFGGTNLVIVRDNQPFALDSLSGRLVQTATRTALAVTSNVADIHLDGNVHLGELAPELQGHINRYFTLEGVRPLPAGGDQRFTYTVKLKDPRLVQKLVPDLKELSAFDLSGDYSRAAARLTAKTRIPVIRYQNYRLDSVQLTIGSDLRQLSYDLRLAQAAQDTTLRLRRPSVTGTVANNLLNTRIAILGDSANRERLALAGSVRAVPVRERGRNGTAYEFVAAAEQIINYERWTAGANNLVRYYPSGAVSADGLRLTNGRSSLEIQSQDPAVPTSPLGVRFTNFQLAELARIVQQRDSLVAGTLNGTVGFGGLGTRQIVFLADATISGLVFQKAPIGDIKVKASNPEPDLYEFEVRLTGGAPAPGQPTNDVALSGIYSTKPGVPLLATLDVWRLNLKLVEPFSAGQVAGTSGALSGQLAIRGALDALQVRGALTTTADAGFVVPQLGSPFRMVSQMIKFDEKGIAFRDFTVLDSAGNKAVVNGYLLTPNLTDYTFDLRATTDHFMAVRNTRKDNQMFYGRLFVDSETRLTGPLTLIAINTRVTVAEGSNLTVESPPDDPSLSGREGLVRFVDKSISLDTMLARQRVLDSARTGAIGYDVKAVVTITDKTPFTIVIDPASGDHLRVRAEGTLDVAMDPAGTIALSGRLTVARGLYRLSLYDLATREFRLKRGSTITWSGDPYNADLNLTAIYNVKAAPADLLAGQGIDDATYNTIARNRLPFRVALSVTDQLVKPTIGFDITLPEDQRGALGGQVEAKLAQLRQANQTSELSKQVFSLLILGRFIQQNPLQSSASENFLTSQLRGSASEVLTNQLQDLTGKYLSNLGVDLGVTNQADYSSGEAKSRTDLNVAVRRQLLNNRLSVRLGTDVPLSGNAGTQATQGSSSASNFAGDVSLEYSIVSDGRLRLRAYRQNAFEDIDGAIVRTGTGLVFQRDYRDLKELFSKVAPETKERRRSSRKQEKEEKKQEKNAPQANPALGPGQEPSKEEQI